MSKTILGFDIGAYELKMVQWNGKKAVAAASEPTPDNLVKNGRIVSYEAMAEFIRKAARKHKLRGRRCAVILPAAHAFLRRMTLPVMTDEQLHINLPYEFRDFLTDNKDKYFYDYAVNALIQDDEGHPRRLDLTAAAVPKSVIQEYRDMFHRAGFHLVTAVPVECAFANLLKQRQSPQGSEFCLLDLGHAGTRIHIFSQHRFEVTRLIELGMGAVDYAIADAMGVDEFIARTYKHSNHENVQYLDGPQGIYASISAEILKAVNFYGFNNRDSDLQDIWCCGGGSRIEPLLDAVSQTVGLHLHPISDLLPADPAVAPELLSACSAALGAAMQ